MVRTGTTIIATLIFGTIPLAYGAFPVHFEPSGEEFRAVTSQFDAQIDSRGFRLRTHDAQSVAIRWSGVLDNRVTGEQPTGGHSNYYLGTDPAGWRRDVPHFARLAGKNIYPGIDLIYRSAGDAVEFDFEVAAGAHPDNVLLNIDAPSRLSAAGDLLIGAHGQFRFRKAEAWQIVDGIHRAVECSFVVTALESAGSRVSLQLGPYDHGRPLTIDPTVEYATYLGGNGNDQIQAAAFDAQGNAILGGVSSSTNFPGTSGLPAGNFIFVTKLSADGTRVLYTTVLGSGAALPYNIVLDRLTSLATDSAGNAFITGITYDTGNFPVTAGAWQMTPPVSGTSGFLSELDSAGHAAYSTYLGNPGWTPVPFAVGVQNGIAYVAGTISSVAFLGTPGAVQRDLLGKSNLFAMAIRPDGSAPLFITALGGSGSEFLYDMKLDGGGNVVLAGTSTSTDFPLAPGELGYRNSTGQTSAVLARLSSDGTQLLDSSYLGTSSVYSVAISPDRSKLIISGNSTLPADLVAKAPRNSISFSATDRLGYVAEFSVAPLTPVWTTVLPLNTGSPQLQVDAQGNIYYANISAWESGGSLSFPQSPVLCKLASDGSRLELCAGVPVQSIIAANAGGEVLLAGTVYGPGLATTPGAAEPTFPAKLAPPSFSTPAYSGAVLKYDTSAFAGDNFFVQAPGTPTSLSITYRIGEPAPAPSALPLIFNTTPFALNFVSSNTALSAAVSADSKAISVSVVPGNAGTAATSAEHVTVSSAANSAASLSIPVSFTVKPSVSFSLTTNQVSITLRSGQTYTPVTVGVTENFGSDYLTLNTSSDSSWLRANVFFDAPHHDQLSIYVSPLSPGTYHGTITVSINGLQQGQQTIGVSYVVTPAVSIQLSSSTLTLHVVKGQPVQPVSVNVTSAVPGVPFSAFVGVSRTWLSYTVTGKTTPGSVQFTADSNAATPGYYDFRFFVSGEDNQQVAGDLLVDVSSGALLDAAPASITYTYFRNGPYTYQGQEVDITSAASPAAVTVTTDKPWLTTSAPGRNPVSAPLALYLFFDTTMPEGVYQGNVTVTGTTGASLKIPVIFSLYDEPHLVYSGNSFTFDYQIDDPPPAAQTLSITSPTLTPGYFAARPGSFPSFLHVTPEGGATPATLTISADPTGRSPGTYKDVIYAQAVGNTQQSLVQIPVTLNVTGNPNAPPSSISAITDAASYLAGTVAPGEIVVLFGSQLGPATLSQATPDPVHGFPTTWSGTVVYFDSTPAPVIYTSSGQTSVVAPFEITGQAKTSVTVSANGKTSTAFTLAVAATNPSIFSADASGSGQAAAFRITASGATALNNTGNPATTGDIISFYATGLGLTSPMQSDGSVTGTPLPSLQSAVRVLIGGKSADVLYSGPAPSLVAGAYQINARVPAGLPSGPAQLLIISGDNPSPPGVTVAIQ